jgi:hypothetical protein
MTNREVIAALAEILISCLCDPAGVGEFFRHAVCYKATIPPGSGKIDPFNKSIARRATIPYALRAMQPSETWPGRN